jgi:2-dehydro-3-deoxyphosphogluconate aldolase / (4S)-4-hydroxy-2-oxoglutarate aldolase
MTKEKVRARIEEIGIIPAIRVSSSEEALFAATAVLGGGIRVVELTMTTPGALEAIAELARISPELMVGAGTVLDALTAHSCLDAGAAFITSPALDLEIVEFGAKNDVLVIPGALTPTEIVAAMKAGTHLIKVFPCSLIGGPSYIRALKAPLPHVGLIASGGVNQQTAGDFIRAGAAAIGIGEDLIPHEAVRRHNSDWIRELARRFMTMVYEARNPGTRAQSR